MAQLHLKLMATSHVAACPSTVSVTLAAPVPWKLLGRVMFTLVQSAT